MKSLRRQSFKQFFAGLIILSLTFTQVSPAMALRSGIEGTSQAGVEEALLQGAVADAPASRAPGAVVRIPAEVTRFLGSSPVRPVGDRIEALQKFVGAEVSGFDFVATVSAPGVPLERRIAALDDYLFMALEAGVVQGQEIDPELVVALLTGNNSRTVGQARAVFSAFERICPTCGDHLYHDQGPAQTAIDFDTHDQLHVRTAIATAVEFLSSGKVPTVNRISGGHHTQEPARSLGTMAVMLSALAKNDEGADSPGVSPVRLGNDDKVLSRLYRLTSEQGPVRLLLRHPRSAGDQADHWISLLGVDIGAQTVTFFSNGQPETVSYDRFLDDYLPSGDLYGLLTPEQASLWAETSPVSPATSQELSSVSGCCGIIITPGRRSGEGQIASMQDLAYRGQDDAGITVHDMNGLETVKEMGSPTNLIRVLETEGQGFTEEGMAWFLTAFPTADLDPRVKLALEKLRAGRALNNQEKRVIFQLYLSLTPEQRQDVEKVSVEQGRDILDAHHYTFVEPGAPGQEGRPPGVSLPIRKDDLYQQHFYTEASPAVVSPVAGRLRKEPGEVDQWNSVGRGNRGEVWSGRFFAIPPPANTTHQAHVEALREFQQEVNRFYDYELSYLRDRLRFHLAARLNEAVTQSALTQDEASRLMREFLRLFESVANGRDIHQTDAEIWRGIWALISGTQVSFSGHIASDPVRHAFRLQTGLIGILKQHPAWRKKVEERFTGLLRADRVFDRRDWFEDWLVENFSNTPSKAFEALIGWFQELFIPENVRRKIGIELGRLDSVTLGYMEIVDRVYGHDRWATVGSKESKDAQPHTDTGFLAGVPDEDLKRLVAEARARTESTRSLEVTAEATQLERMGIQDLLSEHFLVLAVQHLAQNPEQVGKPQRSTPHNGDLDSDVQTGVRPRIRSNGYEPVRHVVDANWQTHVEVILTDTWGLLGLHEYIYDCFRKDTALGLTDGYAYLSSKQNTVGFLPFAYRAKWNEILANLEHAREHNQRSLSVRGADMQIAEEISHRIANLEFARGILIKQGEAGSEIGTGMMSTVEPRLQVFVSHNRPIYLMAVRNADGTLVWQVSSDHRTSLRLFDREAVAQGVRESNELFQWKEQALDVLDKEQLEPTEKELREAQIFREAERKQKAINDRFKLDRMVTFKGEDKYIHVVKKFDPESKQWDLAIEVSTLEGKTVARYVDGKFDPAPPEREKSNVKVERNKSVEVDIASRFGFPSFGEKELHQIPLALRETRFWYGLQPNGVLDMSREGVSSRFGATVDYGLNEQRLLDWFLNGGDTIVITGVGSSENDALAAEALFKNLLPGVKVIIKDPSTLLNTSADFDPKTTMVIGLSWSGTTALTLSIMESLRERGIVVCAITGNPDKEIGSAARDSGGVVKAHTRQEVAVYTTVGFSTILYDLMLMANYLNLLRERIETKPDVAAEFRRRREEVAPSLYAVPEIVRELRDREERSLSNPTSYLHQVGERLSPYNGAGFVGEDPSLPEIGLKIGEVRNSGHTMYTYSDDDPWHLISPDLPPDRRKGWFIDATHPAKLPRALGWVQETARRGQHVVVQTFDEKVEFTEGEIKAGLPERWRTFNEQLKQLAKPDGPNVLVDVFRVPKVHPYVQPLINVQIGAPLATTTAKAAGLTSEFRDAPRNLAKSVTVQSQGRLTRATRVQDFVHIYKSVAAGVEEAVVSLTDYMGGLGQRWSGLTTAQRAVGRLPMRLQEIIAGFTAPSGFSVSREVLTQQFGDGLERLKKVVLLFSEDRNAAIAARMAQELLESRESVTTNSDRDKIFGKDRSRDGTGWQENRVERLINGDLYEIKFSRSPRDAAEENRITVTRMEERDGKWKPISRPELVLIGDERGILDVTPPMVAQRRGEGKTAQYSVNGQWYTITADKGRGINLTAVEPELVGVETELVGIEDPDDLDKLAVDPDNTLVVVLSRSHQRVREAEASLVPIASADSGRNRQEKEQFVRPDAPFVKSEKPFQEAVGALKARYPKLAVFVAGSKDSQLVPQQNAGFARLPVDLDVIDATPAFFLALLRLGVELGSIKGVPQAAVYREGLDAIPNLASSTLAAAYQERVDIGQELFDPAVARVQIPIGHRVVDVQYDRRGERVLFRDGSRELGALPLLVDESFRTVRGLKNAENTVRIGDRLYNVRYQPGFGLIIESRTPDYEGGGSLRDSLVALVQNKFNRPYTNWFVVGGGVDMASADLYRKLLAALGGVQAHALVVDAFVHGPLAEVDDRLGKWSDQVRRKGVNPGYDPNSGTDLTQKDAAVVILSTDKRGSSAADIDGQRVVTRSGRLWKVSTSAARDRSSVLESGAFHVASVPDAPNLLSVVTNMVFASVFAYELGQTIQDPKYRYEPGSTWAQLAQLPKVIPAEEPVAAAWRDSLVEAVEREGRRSDIAAWLVQVYARFRRSPTQPEIATFTSPDRLGMTSYVVVLPYEHRGGREPNPQVAINIGDALRERGVSLDYDTHFFWNGWQETVNTPQLGLLHISIRTADVPEDLGRSVILDAVKPYVRTAQSAGAEEAAREAAQARGWVEQLDRGVRTGYFVAEGGKGGLVAVATGVPGLDVDLNQIDPTAKIAPTAVLQGSETVIQAGAQIHGTVLNAEVHQNAVQRGVLRTVPQLAEDWDPKLLGVKVPSDGSKVIKSVLGPGARIETNQVELTNTRVDSIDDNEYRTVLGLGGMYLNVEIGYGNRHVGEGMIKVMFPTHFEDLVTVYATKGVVQEFAEARIPLGRTYPGDQHNYVEFVGVNGYVWLDSAGTVQIADDLPSVGVPLSEIYASFDGKLPRKAPQLDRLARKPSSGHWWIAEPSGKIGVGAVIVGRPHGPLDGKTAQELLLTQPDLTSVGGLVLVQNQAQGIPLPGGSVEGLGSLEQRPFGLFTEYPNAVWGLVAEAWFQAKRVAGLRKLLDPQFESEAYLTRAALEISQWPVRMVNTAALLAAQRSSAASGSSAGAVRELYGRVPELAAQLRTQFSIDPTPEALEGLQPSYADAVAVARALWQGSPLSQKETLVSAAVSKYPLWTDEAQDFFETPLIDSQVDSKVELHPEARVVGHNRLIGNTKLGRGVVVIGSELHDFQHEGVSDEAYRRGERVFIINSQVTRGSVGQGTDLIQFIGTEVRLGANSPSGFRLSRFENVTVGQNAWSSGAYASNVIAGDNAELKTGAHLRNTTAGREPILGGVLWDSKVGDGYVMNHPGAAGFGVNAPNQVVLDTERNPIGDVPNPTNHSDGVVIGDPRFQGDQVTLEGHVMFAAHTWVRTVTPDGKLEPVTIGGATFIKGTVPPGQQVLPLQFFDGAAPGGPFTSVLDRLGPDFLQFEVGYPARKADNAQISRVPRLLPTLIGQAVDQLAARGEDTQPDRDRLTEHLNSGRWDTTWDPASQSLLLGQRLNLTPRGYVFASAAGAEEVAPLSGILPESNTAVASGINIIAGPHASALAMGSAISHVTMSDGQAAARVVFVVENADQAERVRNVAVPVMVFSASDYNGDIEVALSAARAFLQGAVELGTNNQPVSQTIQLLLHNLFGIELSAESIGAWNIYIQEAIRDLSAQV